MSLSEKSGRVSLRWGDSLPNALNGIRINNMALTFIIRINKRVLNFIIVSPSFNDFCFITIDINKSEAFVHDFTVYLVF
jgi:hypothetical protein